ncbi:hypothetical protein E3P92_03931 [Wallemia ichthyophaga]|uniref:Uncharacterized protein n=2 Tax=Wallemia ichthyophaga TaxID=245174 RepID=A0A4T0GYJ3_WALIC|nr:uncharacterized protein J056_002910 [Wallemia ichthyophaga EXF-994]TIA68681.1 hypothetical protein E3P91_03974 [Wallemia ichthyophaga]EOR03741.1 hypothetical protein J056_002910 [Wallemia ichthyophaga EXF-994]TIA78232.1 hypothetical protein E3P98_03921 [Wallemia ichthyophaga]TIA89203.1 hypothetical protein E3P97_03177 [Wallemia ichthyophaga]TIA94999.1 hypothetical protein E3P95_03941 [Wallemia ichthyophaga]
MSDYNYNDVLLLTISDPNPVYNIVQVFGAVFESTVEDLSRPSSPVSAQAPAFGMSSLKIEDKASDPSEEIKKRSERYRERALDRLKEAAREKGGNGVIGVKCEYTPSGFDGDVQLFEWVASGTVVLLKLKQQMVRMGQ